MSSIKAKLSVVEQLLSNSSQCYSSIMNMADELLSGMDKHQIEVEKQLEKAQAQVRRAQKTADDLGRKASRYRTSMEEAADERDRYNERIEYIYNNPEEVTKYDDNGNEYTEKRIDYEAAYSATRGRDEAQSNYNRYSCGYDDAINAQGEAESSVEICKSYENSIRNILSIIKEVKFEMKKQISNAEMEGEHNAQALNGVINSLNSYLASKSVFMPIGTRYEEFAGESSSSGASLYADGSNSSIEDFISTINDNMKSYQASNVYKDALSYAGIENSPELQAKMQDKLSDVLKNSDVSIRVKHEMLPNILEDGRFKNCFETRTSGGSTDYDGRKAAAGYMFGSDTTNETALEKYGYLESKTPSVPYYPMSQYGGVIVKMKRDAINASFTCGDSLGFYQNKQDGGVGATINNPSLSTMNKYQLKTLADAIKNATEVPSDPHEFANFLAEGERALSGKASPQYIEVQLHGILNTSAIESVTFVESWGNPSPVLTQKLDSLGIPYKISSLK